MEKGFRLKGGLGVQAEGVQAEGFGTLAFSLNPFSLNYLNPRGITEISFSNLIEAVA